MSGTIAPLTFSSAGPQPQDPTTIRTNLINAVAAESPGYTANLPGSMIEDISSTDVLAIVQIDQLRIDALNGLSPTTMNYYLLVQLGNALGLPLGQPTNASVDVVFSGPAGYVLAVGFTVSDGTNQYQLSDGGVIQIGGTSQPLTAVCTNSNTFAVPASSVTQLVTSVPTGTTIAVTNPNAGTPATTTETFQAYQARILQAQQVTSVGTPQFIKTLLQKIPGVVPQQVSVRSAYGGLEVICGGGDEYAITYALLQSVGNISDLVGSQIGIGSITQANPGVVTTLLNHGYTTGQVVTFSGVGGMTALNSGSYTITVLTETTFSIGVNTSGYPAFTSGGQVLPNLRNNLVTLIDYPDTYTIPFVTPPQQTVNIQATWNTNEANFVAAASVAQLAVPAIVSYVNGITVGQPINLLQLTAVFQTAVASILTVQYLSRLVFVVEINGIAVSPSSGTGIVSGDPESYFYATSTTVTVAQG